MQVRANATQTNAQKKQVTRSSEATEAFHAKSMHLQRIWCDVNSAPSGSCRIRSSAATFHNTTCPCDAAEVAANNAARGTSGSIT